jgi:transposase
MGGRAGPRETVGEASPRSAGGGRMRNALELVDVDSDRLEEVLRRAEQALDEKDAELIRAVFESYAYVTELVEDKDTTIRRLRQLFFGARTEKTEAVVGQKPEAAVPRDAVVDAGFAAGEGNPDESDAAAASKGHGRNGAEAYRGAARIDVPHPSLTAGDACPACSQGTVYEKAPGVLVRITGQPPLAATVYRLQKLRCHLCGQVFTADAPSEAGPRKYDATAGSMIGLLKYGSGLPFNRLEGLQGDLGVPLPASTQWDVVEAVATSLTPVLDELIRQAAQGEVLHNDDSVPSEGWHVLWEPVPPG